MGTTAEKCKELLELLESAVEIKDDDAYREAVVGLKYLQLLLCQAYEREKVWIGELQALTGMDDAAFFKAKKDELWNAERKGYEAYSDIFTDDEEEED